MSYRLTDADELDVRAYLLDALDEEPDADEHVHAGGSAEDSRRFHEIYLPMLRQDRSLRCGPVMPSMRKSGHSPLAAAGHSNAVNASARARTVRAAMARLPHEMLAVLAAYLDGRTGSDLTLWADLAGVVAMTSAARAYQAKHWPGFGMLTSPYREEHALAELGRRIRAGKATEADKDADAAIRAEAEIKLSRACKAAARALEEARRTAAVRAV